MINGSARVDQLPGIKGRSYLFRVTDGTSGTPYDISTNDSQLLKEWIDMLQVVSKCITLCLVLSTYNLSISL